jgi:hypothetical protein
MRGGGAWEEVCGGRGGGGERRRAGGGGGRGGREEGRGEEKEEGQERKEEEEKGVTELEDGGRALIKLWLAGVSFFLSTARSVAVRGGGRGGADREESSLVIEFDQRGWEATNSAVLRL